MGKTGSDRRARGGTPSTGAAPTLGDRCLLPATSDQRENHMISPKQVCVIGAGVSGLAAAKAFAAHGHKVTIIEKRGDFGGGWGPARSCPDVRRQSPKDLCRSTDQPMPVT